jgi:methionyl-tRNA formyltransferase
MSRPTRPRVVFFCGHHSPFGAAHLLPILESRFEVVAVVLASERRWEQFGNQLRGKEPLRDHPDPPLSRLVGQASNWLRHPLATLRERVVPVRDEEPPALALLRQRRVEVLTVDDANAETSLARLRALGADLFLAAAYPQIFSAALLDIPPLGAVNAHPSLLPRFRGAHPHFWAIATGERATGVTAHFMTPRLGDGDIIAQRGVPIDGCVYGELYERINQAVPALVADVERFFLEGDREAQPQDASAATFFRGDREVHRRIFWNLMPAERVHDLIRTERAFCFFRGLRVQLYASTVQASNRNMTNGVRVEPATIVDLTRDGIVVSALDGFVQIRKIQSSLGILDTPEWAQRVQLDLGQKLE